MPASPGVAVSRAWVRASAGVAHGCGRALRVGRAPEVRRAARRRGASKAVASSAQRCRRWSSAQMPCSASNGQGLIRGSGPIMQPSREPRDARRPHRDPWTAPYRPRATRTKRPLCTWLVMSGELKPESWAWAVVKWPACPVAVTKRPTWSGRGAAAASSIPCMMRNSGTTRCTSERPGTDGGNHSRPLCGPSPPRSAPLDPGRVGRSPPGSSRVGQA